VKSLLILEDESSRERFVNEAKILARMSHPNVPAIYDVKFGQQDMKIYFEFIDGSNLREVIPDGAYPSMEEAKRWFSQVAAALEHAHTMGIIHRDVKAREHYHFHRSQVRISSRLRNRPNCRRCQEDHGEGVCHWDTRLHVA